MNKALLILVSFLFLTLHLKAQNYAQIASIPISVTTTDTPASITLRWPFDSNVNSYSIYRKLKDAKSWGTSVATYASKDSLRYIDRNVELGKAYEYRVTRNSNAGPGTGYVFAGLKYEAQELNYKGTILALIDSRIANNLAPEIQQWKDDLTAESWNVVSDIIIDTLQAPAVKARIKNWKSQHSDLRTIFIIGHVRVPYSGELNPDGHTDHIGAWPADGYYADLDGVWTDATVNNTSAGRIENQNIPRDGKFDQSIIPSDLDLEIGRVDFYNMPALVKTETELLKNYFNKNHAFRTAQFKPNRKAVIMDNFNFNEGFAQSGYKNFSVFFTDNNVFTGDYRNDLLKDSYLWSYGAGGGWYQGAGGISETANMAKDSLQSVFTFLFGSYFGDWDSQDNFLRAALASGTILTSAWAGRPHWQVHQMAMGENIGYGSRLTQNNQTLYSTGFSARGVHVALMGDPSLTLFPTKKISGLTITENKEFIDLKWNASADATVGYNIYRRKLGEKKFELIASRVKGESYQDKCLSFNTSYEYLVRGVNLEKSASGSFYNLSAGIVNTVTINHDNSTMSSMIVLDDFEAINAKSFSTNSNEVEWLINGKSYGSDQKLLTNLECKGQQATICLISRNTCDVDTSCKVLNYECSIPSLEKVNVSGAFCAGDTATVCATLKGGASPFTYVWSNGSTTECTKVVNSSTLQLTVISRLNTTLNEMVIYVAPTEINVNIQVTDAKPGKNGSINVMITGGTPPYVINGVSDPLDIPPGNYTLEIEDANGCTKKVNFSVKLNSASIDLDPSNEIQIIPNPARDLIKIYNKTNIHFNDIQLIDMTGKAIKKFGPDIPTSLSVSDLTSGYYYFEFRSKEKTITVPFCKL